MSRRRVLRVCAVLAFASVAVAAALPMLFEHAIRGKLEDLGFHDVDVKLDKLGLDRAVLHGHVDDVQLGTVVIEPGLRLLWAQPRRVSIPDAHVSTAALARVQDTLAHAPKPAPKKRDPAKIDISIELSDPTSKQWSASATGTVAIGDDVRLENGHVELALSHGKQASVSLAKVKVTADAAGSLSPMQITARGAIRAARVDAGPVHATQVAIPFTFDTRGLAFQRGSASLFGGTVETEPFGLRARAIQLRARGLQLAEIVGDDSRVEAAGLVDGVLAVRVDQPQLATGELHARNAGRLRIRDAGWRKRLAAIKGPAGSAVTAALLDFQYDKLALALGAPGDKHDVTVSMAGRGATNQQPLDLVVRVNGAREAAGRWLGKTP